jgi:hypothetical protein
LAGKPQTAGRILMTDAIPINLRRMDTRKWEQIWLEKLDREMKTHGLDGDVARSYRAVVGKFLTLYPGNPRAVGLDKLCDFVKAQKSDISPMLIFFFEYVAFSQEHQDTVRSCARDRLAQAAEKSKQPKPAKKKAAPKNRKKKA